LRQFRGRGSSWRVILAEAVPNRAVFPYNQAHENISA
jgi:hypothetical protein